MAEADDAAGFSAMAKTNLAADRGRPSRPDILAIENDANELHIGLNL